MSSVLRIATRKSALAVAQTKLVADALVSANPGLAYELVTMTTEGDRRLDKSLASFGGKGVFIKELEVSLLEGRADIAVHSLKDMPAEVLPEFKLAAVMRREDPRDAFVARGGASGTKFMDLPTGARVGTGSIRRVVQLKALRPDIEYVPIRGNIQTRLSKLEELDGVVVGPVERGQRHPVHGQSRGEPGGAPEQFAFLVRSLERLGVSAAVIGDKVVARPLADGAASTV